MNTGHIGKSPCRSSLTYSTHDNPGTTEDEKLQAILMMMMTDQCHDDHDGHDDVDVDDDDDEGPGSTRKSSHSQSRNAASSEIKEAFKCHFL